MNAPKTNTLLQNRKFISSLNACLYFVVLLLFTSCGQSPSSSKPKEKVAPRYANWSRSPKSDEPLWRKDRGPILHGIVRKEYTKLDPYLEKMDDDYRCGKSVRSVFYDAFENYHRRSNDAVRYHPQYEEGFIEWVKLKPDSPAPTLGLAALMVDRAWMHRGGGWASEVSQEGWKGFKENLVKAQKILTDAPDFVRQDPYYYKLQITVGLSAGAPLGEIQKYFEAGQKIDPLYIDLYLAVTNFLKPRWYGETETHWHDWLVEALEYEELTDEDRLVIYAVAVRQEIKFGYETYGTAAAFTEMGIDKDRFMKGLSTYVKRYNESSDWPLNYLYHAWKAGDVEAMKDAVALSDRKYDSKRYKPVKELWSMFDQIIKEYPEMASVINGTAN